jgi:WD40 repeat protein
MFSELMCVCVVGGRAEHQSRDGTLLLVEVAEPDAPGQRVCATPTAVLKAQGIFDIKWAGAVGSESEGAPILGHAAADGSLCTYTLAVGESGSEAATSDQGSANADAPAAPTSASDQGGAGSDPGDASSAGNGAAQPRMRLHPLGRIDCTADGVSVGSSLSLSLDWNDRKIGNQEPTVAVSMSDGTVCTCRVGQTEMTKLTQWQAHDLEAWIASFNPHAPHMLFTGADDRKLKCWDTRTDPELGAMMTNSKAHEAGVCSIQCNPHSEYCLATGSYDEQVGQTVRPAPCPRYLGPAPAHTLRLRLPAIACV